jgi:hypothetical protein
VPDTLPKNGVGVAEDKKEAVSDEGFIANSEDEEEASRYTGKFGYLATFDYNITDGEDVLGIPEGVLGLANDYPGGIDFRKDCF